MEEPSNVPYVISLLYALKRFAILNIIVGGLLGEELKCQRPTRRNLKVRRKFNNTKGPTNTCATRTRAKGSEKGFDKRHYDINHNIRTKKN